MAQPVQSINGINQNNDVNLNVGMSDTNQNPKAIANQSANARVNKDKTGYDTSKESNSDIEKEEITEQKSESNVENTITEETNTNAPATLESDLASLLNKLESSATPEELKITARQMIVRLQRMSETGVFSKEYDILSTYIDWITSYPWNNYADEILDMDRVKQMLDDEHYGLESVKERVLTYLAVRKLLVEKKDFEAVKRSPVVCMVGLQGIGKTTMAKSMAKALNRPFYRISMGAIGSVLEIRGRHKAVDGAEPGQIVKAIIRTGVRNPIILLDELDKASGEAGLLADVMATMLEVLDPEQNTTFRDHYFDYPIDLSEVMFVVSANKMGTFSAALLDRMEVIRMPSYTDEEKMVIARDYLLPRVRQSTGLEDDQLEFSPDLWPSIIRPLGFDSGIRSLQRMIENIARKAALEIVQGKTQKVYITPENYQSYLPMI